MHVIKINEQHNKLAEWERYDFIVNEMWDGGHDNNLYPLLNGIDPNQDSYFNEIQAPVLIKELQTLYEEVAFEDSKEPIVRLIKFIEGIDTHELVKFVSD